MRFADTDRSDKQQSGLLGGVLLDKSSGKIRAVPMLAWSLSSGSYLEGGGFAMLVPRGNARRREQAFPAALARGNRSAPLRAARRVRWCASQCLRRGGTSFQLSVHDNRPASLGIRLDCPACRRKLSRFTSPFAEPLSVRSVSSVVPLAFDSCRNPIRVHQRNPRSPLSFCPALSVMIRANPGPSCLTLQ